MDKEPDLAKTCNELWANSPLADFKSPVLDGIDADLGQIRLLVQDVGPLLSPDIRSFVQHLLRRTSYRQIRFFTQLRFEVQEPVAESRDGLEQEITGLLGRYWHGGHFGVLSDDRETPKIWLYGLGLAKQEILNEISGVFRQRGVSVAQLILDLDQLAIDRGF